MTHPTDNQSQASQVKVMTWNLYFGASTDLLRTAETPDIPGIVADILQMVKATDFPARAQIVAKEIARTAPDLIGLQEVALWRVCSPGRFMQSARRHLMSKNKLLRCFGLLAWLLHGTQRNANEVLYDFLEILLSELTRLGLNYAPVAVRTGADIEAPAATGVDLRYTDRNVILARTDLPPGQFRVLNGRAGDFSQSFSKGVLAGVGVNIARGWVAVDVQVGTRLFHFFNTHLDPDCPKVQLSQARNLLRITADGELPLVVVGDFNHDANLAGSYFFKELAAGGLVDIWPQAGVGNGHTALHDDNLLNAESCLDARIDLIMTRGDVKAVSAELTGAHPAYRTPEGLSTAGRLWPSDHAGVVAALEII